MPLTLTVKGVDLRVSLLLWRAYGRRGVTAAMLSRTYALNPGLAALGPILPLGTVLTLPDLPTALAQPKRATVNLFGGV